MLCSILVAENAAELSQYYGNIPARSVGAILRSLVVLEQQGGKIFFGEPSLDIADLIVHSRRWPWCYQRPSSY